MAIKKRPPVDTDRDARIEAFGAAAGTRTNLAEPTVTVSGTPALAFSATRDVKAPLKPMLIRLQGWEHDLLKEVAELDGRSMHSMAKTLLIPALEAMRAAQRPS